MSRPRLNLILPLSCLAIAALACSVLPGGGTASSLQATANAALTQAAVAAATAGAQGSSLQATASAARTQALATANAAGAGQPTAGATTAAAGGNTTGGPQDVPLIDPHTVVTASDQELTYDTTVDVQTVAKFYTDQMPKLGWAVEGSPYVTASLAKMGFTKAGKIVTIGITVDPKTQQTVVGALVE